jgi:AcrR family transcriptional regulator
MEIANRLKIKSSSLYWHIKTKNEIYCKILERIYNGIEIQKDIKDSRKYLQEIYKQYRKELLKIKNSVEIVRKAKELSVEHMDLIKETQRHIKIIGIKEKYCIALSKMLNNYVLTFVENEEKNKEREEEFNYGLEVIIKGIQTS